MEKGKIKLNIILKNKMIYEKILFNAPIRYLKDFIIG